MFSFFLAKRFFFQTGIHGSAKSSRRVSAPTVRNATFGIAVGIAIMVLSVCIVRGYQHEISSRVVGFASHIVVMAPQASVSPEAHPVVTDEALIRQVRQVPGVVHVQRFSQKMGVLKTKGDFAGFMLKGVASDYDLSMLRQYVIAGRIPDFSDKRSSNDILLSHYLADKLGLKVGDKVYSYYFAQTIKQRRFRIAAIYETHLKQFDQTYVWTDLHTVNQLNGWTVGQSSGLEVRLASMDGLDKATQDLTRILRGKADAYGATYVVESVDKNPQTASILTWLNLLDLNVKIILGIMVCVTGFTMISGLLILILERTRTIGVLKALGAGNTRIRHVFLWLSFLIIGRGMLIGNAIALILIYLQREFHFVPLDPQQYYINAVPVEFDAGWILGVNAASLLVTVLTLVVPSFLVSRIQPAEAIRFD